MELTECRCASASRMQDCPVVLFVSGAREVFGGLEHYLQNSNPEHLCRGFQFEYLDCYASLKDWYQQNRGRFVSVVIQEVDYTQTRNEKKLLGYPEVRSPVPKKFDPLAYQGFLIYASMRQNNIDRIAPTLFITKPGRLMYARQFTDFIIYPGYGSCRFMEELPDRQNFLAGIAENIHALALRPLGDGERQHWRQTHEMVVGRSRKMAHLVREIERIGPSDAIALLLGQPGVGKELVANALHRCSNRYERGIPGREWPHTVNIAALDKNLIEDELFGHEKGAFTGAVSERKGIFETARDSTVFLDEIGDINQETQVRLLRAMEYRRIKRLGSSYETTVNMRIVASTNRTIEDLRPRFRPDFYSRLVQHCIPIPSLAERWQDEDSRIAEQDLNEIFLYVVDKMNQDPRHGRQLQIERAAVRFLHQLVEEHINGINGIFQGNMRTLRNIIERAYERAQYDGSPEVRLGHIISTLGMIHLMNTQVATEKGGSVEQVAGSLNLRVIEKKAIAEALARCRNNQTQAAELLGIHRDTLRRKISEYDL